MADDLDEVTEPDELEAVELEDLADDELIDEDLADPLVDDDDLVDDLVDDELVDDIVEVDPVADPSAKVVVPAPAPAATATADEAEEEDDEVDDEDVEASLDEILKERLVVEEEEVEDEEVAEPDDRSEISERVLPKQPDEFVCSSCFLVKNASQLADSDKGLCRDCV
jgi:hypothetical protein